MWEVEFYPTGSIRSPVTDFIDRLQKDTVSKVRNVIKLLSEYGPLLRAPYSKKLSGYNHLFELRTSGKTPVRLLYTVVNKKFIILNAFIKKTNKTPLNDLKTAIFRISNLT